MQALEQYTRFCPGEEGILISDAVCYGRRRVNYSKCKGCQFNDDERADAPPQYSSAAIALARKTSERMIEELDKVFKAYDIRGVYPDPLGEDLAWRIGFAAGSFLRSNLRGIDRSDQDMNRIVVGRDMRKSSPPMAAALIEGLRTTGAPVVDIGMIDTSQLYFAVNHLKCCGGIQTTASHNPAQYSGFKICARGGKPVGIDTGLQEIRQISHNASRYEAAGMGGMEECDLTEAYRDFLLGFLKKPKEFKIVIDASNGMAGKWVPIIFGDVERLRIEALNFKHDGEFVHDPNPLVPANLKPTQDRVKKTSADLGVCFDGDADRCMLVDEKGEIIGCDLITALLSRYFLKKNPKATITYDLRSSEIVPETVTKSGGSPCRSRVGHAFMKKAMAEAESIFGGELSGHFYFKDNWYCDSGFLAFIHTINVMSQSKKTISELIKPFRKYHQSGERNFVNEDKDGTIRQLAEKYADAKVDYLDGISVQHGKWRFNVRKSNTEPLLRLNMEASTAELLEEKLSEVAELLGEAVDH